MLFIEHHCKFEFYYTTPTKQLRLTYEYLSNDARPMQRLTIASTDPRSTYVIIRQQPDFINGIHKYPPDVSIYQYKWSFLNYDHYCFIDCLKFDVFRGMMDVDRFNMLKNVIDKVNEKITDLKAEQLYKEELKEHQTVAFVYDLFK